jgi:hypothetical protein
MEVGRAAQAPPRLMATMVCWAAYAIGLAALCPYS